VADVAATDTRMQILEAVRRRLLADGYAGLSTRKVAEEGYATGGRSDSRRLQRPNHRGPRPGSAAPRGSPAKQQAPKARPTAASRRGLRRWQPVSGRRR
jgi:hypothetical protein